LIRPYKMLGLSGFEGKILVHVAILFSKKL